MATGVGLRIADEDSTAAIVTDGGELHYVVRESVLHMSDDGDTVLGGEPPADHSHSITGFVAAVGDPAGITVDDGEAYRAEDLVATALFCLINLTAEHLSGAAEFYATHPGGWPAEQVQALREALDYLGLKSVVLVSEADLPAVDTAEPGKSFSYDAARAALAAVLATPAGATPPDPTAAENSTIVTDVIPAVPVPETQQAYSAAMPIATALPTEAITDVPETPAPAPQPTPKEDRKRVTVLIAAAALVGLTLGGVGVALLFRGEDSPAVPPVRDAQSGVSTTSTVAPPPPPPAQPVAPPPAPITTEPPIVTTTTTEPEPAPPPPPPTTTEEPTTTTVPPTTTPEETTSPTRTRPRNPWQPYDPENPFEWWETPTVPR
ncbi:hypothetical protein IU433_14405 [Nocardia puris]|uniref:hypothetical protein n=1 Tax=Nocardia puris TaxID=208602 RepID=UPI001895980D|nr:hypothetical protein [Nocardia puris]MBF6214944.1 hypothetical protein [Nocardia puris]MBF6364788.1 hypothetical protein [Nocardia puris]MBF6460229.1 hypothetical protein [Nocardia puris]